MKRSQSPRVAAPSASVLTPEARAYLSKIGKKGGQKGKRKLSKEEAKSMANKRWGKEKNLGN